MDELRALRDEVAALREEQAATLALPPAANAERIDQALEAELQEDNAPPERPESDPTAERTGDGQGAADGVLVRAACWVERALRR